MDSTGLNETKSEIRARLDELRELRELLSPHGMASEALDRRRRELHVLLGAAEEDLFKSVLQSHKTLCAVKEMEEDAAYGQDPAMYYSLAVCGEAGEMGNKIVKALRNGDDPEAARRAVISELPDVIIYSAVLAHVLGIDLTKLVNDKVGVVIQRAKDGYYGGSLKKSRATGASPVRRRAAAPEDVPSGVWRLRTVAVDVLLVALLVAAVLLLLLRT